MLVAYSDASMGLVPPPLVPLLLELLSLLLGVVGNKVGYAEEGAKEGE